MICHCSRRASFSRQFGVGEGWGLFLSFLLLKNLRLQSFLSFCSICRPAGIILLLEGQCMRLTEDKSVTHRMRKKVADKDLGVQFRSGDFHCRG
jgi:hypothetical protein